MPWVTISYSDGRRLMSPKADQVRSLLATANAPKWWVRRSHLLAGPDEPVGERAVHDAAERGHQQLDLAQRVLAAELLLDGGAGQQQGRVTLDDAVNVVTHPQDGPDGAVLSHLLSPLLLS